MVLESKSGTVLVYRIFFLKKTYDLSSLSCALMSGDYFGPILVGFRGHQFPWITCSFLMHFISNTF
jgi:hypothetical protein